MSLLYICFIYECLKPLLKNYMLYICHYKTCTNNMIQTFKRTKYLSKKFRAFYKYVLVAPDKFEILARRRHYCTVLRIPVRETII